MPSPQRTLSKSVFGQALTYGLASAASMAVPFVLAPILTHHLTPKDYGTITMLQILAQVASPLVGVGTQGAIRRRYFDYDDQEISSYVMSCTVVAFVLLTILLAITIVLQPILGDDSELPIRWLMVLGPWIASEYLVSLGKTFLQLEQRALAFGLVQGGVAIAELSLSLLLVVTFHMGWQGRVIGHVGAESVFAVLSVALLLRRIDVRRPPRREHAVDALRYGLPVVPYVMLERIIALTDRSLVVVMIGLAAGGEYAFASQIAALLLVATQAFSTAWQPWLFARMSENTPEARQEIRRALWSCMLLLPVGAMMLVWIAPRVLPLLIDEKFWPCLKLIPWLAAAYVARGASQILTAFVLFEGKNRPLVSATLAGAVVNLIGCLVLIPRMGAAGAVIATFVAFSLTAVTMARSARAAWVTVSSRVS